MIKNYAAHMEAICNSNSQNNKLNNHKFPESDRSYCRNYALLLCSQKRCKSFKYKNSQINNLEMVTSKSVETI